MSSEISRHPGLVAADQHAAVNGQGLGRGPSTTVTGAAGLKVDAAPVSQTAQRRATSVPLVFIHMACNDPENGDFAGRVAQISLENEALQLTARAWEITTLRGCPKLREDTKRGKRVFYLAGKPWQFERHTSWIGNWCWDGYAMVAPAATEFLTWLHRRALFQCEGGWEELCEAWDKPAPLRLPEGWWKL